MKKLVSSLTLGLVITLSFGQTRVQVDNGLGYEENINFAPGFVEQSDGQLNRFDLYANSVFHDLRLNIKTKKEWKKKTLNLAAERKNRNYFNAEEYNQIQHKLEGDFSVLFSKYSKLKLELNYTEKDRRGLDFDASEFSLPLGYKNMMASSKFQFRLSKKNRTSLQLNLGRKKFNDSERRASYYDLKGITLSTKKVLWKNHLYRIYGIKAGYAQRTYNFFYFRDERNDVRPLGYLNLGIFAKHQLSKKWTCASTIDFEKRYDRIQNRFGFINVNPAVSLTYKGKNRLIKLKPEYVLRRFESGLMLNPEVVPDNLQFDYIKFSLYASERISKSLTLFTKCKFVSRESNNFNHDMFVYRSYENMFFSLGLKWKSTLSKKNHVKVKI